MAVRRPASHLPMRASGVWRILRGVKTLSHRPETAEYRRLEEQVTPADHPAKRFREVSRCDSKADM